MSKPIRNTQIGPLKLRGWSDGMIEISLEGTKVGAQLEIMQLNQLAGEIMLIRDAKIGKKGEK